jgi:hypothetical protein
MPAYYINDAGTWRKAKAAYINDGTAWRKAKAIYINDAGTWRKVFAGVTVNPAFYAFLGNYGTSAALRTSTLTMNPDGSTSVAGAQSAWSNWLVPLSAGAGSDFWVKITLVTSSNAVFGGTMSYGATWWPLSVAQTISVRNSTSAQNSTGQFTFTFATDAAGANVVATLTSVDWDVGYQF